MANRLCTYVAQSTRKALKLNVKMSIREGYMSETKTCCQFHCADAQLRIPHFCVIFWLFRLPSPFDCTLYDGHRSKEINLMVAKAQKQTQFG